MINNLEKSYVQLTLEGIAEYCYVNSSIAKYEGKDVGYSLNLLIDENTEKELLPIANKIIDVAQSPDWVNSKGKKVPKGK